MPTDPTGTVGLSTGRRWSIVVVSLVVTASAFVFINGVAFLIPALEDDQGTPLAEAGLLSSMPSFGMVTTLILWGYLLDRVGERIVLTIGSALTAAAAYAATTVHTMVSFAALLFVGGMAAASCNSAGGRLVSGWFPPEQRGLAMGVRQTAQPLGIALGALVIPELAERSRSATSALIFPARALCGVGGAQRRGHRRPATQGMGRGHRPGAGQPVPRIVGTAANPRGLSAVDGAADGDRDLHADLADHELPVVDRVGSSSGHAVAAARGRGPGHGRPVVGPGRVAVAAGPHHGRRGRPGVWPGWRLPIICAHRSPCH